MEIKPVKVVGAETKGQGVIRMLATVKDQAWDLRNRQGSGSLVMALFHSVDGKGQPLKGLAEKVGGVEGC